MKPKTITHLNLIELSVFAINRKFTRVVLKWKWSGHEKHLAII